MKRLFILALLLALALPAEAGPLSFLKRIAVSPVHFVEKHPRFAAAATTLALTSIYQYKATTRCSLGDVERCQLGYGERRAGDWVTIGTGAAMLGISEACWKQTNNWKGCYGLAYWVPAYQVAAGTSDYLRYKPEKQ